MKTKSNQIFFKSLLISLLFAISFLSSNMPVYAKGNIPSICQTEHPLTPRADKKEWKYKKINGKLYKRLYNSTRKKWEGPWIPA